MRESDGVDPYEAIVERARTLALKAMEDGWNGPPYDPFELAELVGVDVVARQNLEDARLVSVEAGARSRIEFNPNRRPARVRFSLAHELGHLLFSDHEERVRYRNESHHAERSDDWQLEVLCNVAAAEFLMPVGAFPLAKAEDLSLPHLLDLRTSFGVSTEALLRRVIKLTSRPACMFAAARPDEDGQAFRVDYLVGSRALRKGFATDGRLPADSVLAECTAVGFSADRTERWAQDEVYVQAVGIPPYPGDRFPRIIGLAQPADEVSSSVEGMRYLRGDATQPKGAEPRIIAHVVNDRARSWGGRGFAASLASRFEGAREAYSEWAHDAERRKLGSVHIWEAAPSLWIASLVAQAGYGEQPNGRPRLKLLALRNCLEVLAREAADRGATVHMPPIGTGQGGTPWPPIRDLIVEELTDYEVLVTVYVLPESPMPEDTLAQAQLVLA
jgi:Zn-dependent peptidase ImmA (M78 family)/O-acetyl-ADP-ribose deacetylase (regulator of RNase III)